MSYLYNPKLRNCEIRKYTSTIFQGVNVDYGGSDNVDAYHSNIIWLKLYIINFFPHHAQCIFSVCYIVANYMWRSEENRAKIWKYKNGVMISPNKDHATLYVTQKTNSDICGQNVMIFFLF